MALRLPNPTPQAQFVLAFLLKPTLFFKHFAGLLLLLLLPDLFREMGGWRETLGFRSRTNFQGLNQSSSREKDSQKSERRKESVAGQCRMRRELS